MQRISRAVRSDDDSGTSTDVLYIFSDKSTNDESLDSAPEQESEDDLEDDSDNNSILDGEDEQEHPAAYYLKEAEYLNVSQLQQKQYSPRTQANLDKTWEYWDQFCYEGNHDLIERFRWLSNSKETWYLVYKAEVGQGLGKDTTVKILDVLVIVAQEKGLLHGRRPKATMYIEDVAEFACNLVLTLIRDPDGGRLRLFIYLTPEFTKTFLGEKEQNTFPIPEIIFDPTLVLSPHVFLLGMLFRIQAFKNFSTEGLVVDCPENLYNLGVLDGLGQQELKLKDEILDQFVFCQAVREPDGI
ncbi:hypothetical protein BDV09DRAFT_201273 [Aspergillus tetrazonus]